MDNTNNPTTNGGTYMDKIIKEILQLLKAEENKDKQFSIQEDLKNHYNIQIQLVPPTEDYIRYPPTKLFQEAGDKKTIKKKYQQLIKQLQNQKPVHIITMGKSPDLYEVNLEEHIIYKGKKATNKGETKTDNENNPIMQPNSIKAVIGATPDRNIKNYTNRQIANLPEEYEGTWTFHNKHMNHIPINGTFDDIKSKLNQTTAIWDHNNSTDTLRIIYDYYIQQGIAQRIDTPSRPGFYWDDQKQEIITVKYTPRQPTEDQLKQAYTLLHQLSKTLNKNDHGERLATIIRWALIAPFQYAIKQQGGETKYLHLYGSPGTGKTTIYATIPLYIWNIADEQHIEPGSTESAAQTRHLLGRTSFPIIYDDTKNILNNPRKVSMFKAATSNTKAQGKYGNNGTFQEFPAITPLIFTSNDQIIDEEQGAMTRRFIQIEYTPEDQPTQLEREQYHKQYPKQKLQTLQYIGQAFSTYILAHPKTLIGDQTTNNVNQWLTQQIKKYGNPDDIQWINQTYNPGSREQYNQLLTQQLKEWFQQQINKEMKRIHLANDDLHMEEIIDKDTRTAVWVTIKSPTQLTWLNPTRDLKAILISPTINNKLQQALNISYNQAMKRLGWQIKSQRDNQRDNHGNIIDKDKVIRAARVEFDDFLYKIYNIVPEPDMEDIPYDIPDEYFL